MKRMREGCLGDPSGSTTTSGLHLAVAGSPVDDALELGALAELMLDALPFFFLLVDSRHTIHFANRAVRDAMGDRGLQLTGAYCPTLHGLGHPFPGCPLEEAVESHSAVERELFDRASSSWVSSAIYPTPIRTRSGHGVYAHVVRDITARRRAEAAAAESAAVEQLVARLSARFLSAAPRQIEQELSDALRMICDFLGCTRYAAYLQAEASDHLELCLTWQSPSHTHAWPSLSDSIAREHATELARQHEEELPSQVGVEPLPSRRAPSEQVAYVPICSEGALRGLVHFGQWSPVKGARLRDSRLLKLLSSTLSVALERLRATKDISAHAERLRSMALELGAAEERERRRIASDLHDQIGQTLALSLLQVSKLRSQATSPAADQALSDLHGHIEAALHDAKSLMFELSPPILHQFGLGAALEWMLEQCSERHGLKCRLVDEAGTARLDDDERMFLFRAAQELVSNVHRHARATRVELTLSRSDGRLSLCVADDGAGFDGAALRNGGRPHQTGFGLFSIEERLRHLGGAMRVESSPGRGTRVTLELPELPVEEELPA